MMRMNVIILVALYVFVPFAVAAAETDTPPVAARGGHGDHSHGEHAGMDGMPGSGMMMKPRAWTDYPTLKTRMSGESRENRVVTVVPQNIVVGSVDAFSNNLKDEHGRRQLPMEMGGAVLDKPENGGFHWLSAREEQADRILVASTVYAIGERSAKDPTAMFMQQKHELEIIPQPYPREHSRYRAGENWKFIVHFNGKPLADQKVALETQNGTKAEWVSDAEGVISIRLPDDFKADEKKEGGERRGGMQGMQGSDFVLAAEHIEGSKTYLTAFSGSYGKNAYDKRSLAMGLGFTLLGMVGAIPLLRQRKTSPKNNDAATKKEEV